MYRLLLVTITLSFLTGCHKPTDKSICWSKPTITTIGERITRFNTVHPDLRGDVINRLGLVASGKLVANDAIEGFYAITIDEKTAATVCGFTYTSTIQDEGKDIVLPESKQVIFTVFQGGSGSTIDFDDNQLALIIMSAQPIPRIKMIVTS